MDKLSPFIFWCQKVMPAVLDDSLSYYECLCKIVAKLNDTIKAVNNIVANQSELVNQFNQLKTYVDNYFENLDVQEEINNKLDAMAESGELESIIAQYLQFNTATIFNTVSDMINSPNLHDGMYTQTLGYYSSNDLGGTYYEISTVETLYSIPLLHNLYASPIGIYDINVKMFGAYGNGINNDSDFIQTSINYCHDYNIKKIIIPCGTYIIDSTVNIPSNIEIIGDYTSFTAKNGTILLRKNDISIFNLQGDSYSQPDGNNVSNVIIKNMMLRTDAESILMTGSLYLFRTIYNVFENVHFSGNGYAIVFDKASFDMRFNNCSFTGNSLISTCNAQTDSFNSANYYGTNNIIFNSCRWETYSTGPLIQLNNYTNQIVFNNPKFEGALSDGSSLIKCVENTSTIIVNSGLITMLTESDCSIVDLQDTRKSKFEIFANMFVESTTKPLIILNKVSATDIIINPTFNINDYQLSYYIENSNNVDSNSVTVGGSLTTSTYFNSKQIFSNPEYLNKSITLNTISASSSSVPLTNFKIKKSIDSNYSLWNIGPNFNNFTENITQFIIQAPNNTVVARFTPLNSYINGLVLPNPNEQPPDANGQLYLNTFSDNSVPCLNLQINGSNKRIGWGSSFPTTGTWAAGSIVINTSPTVGSPAGWICTSTGTPGTWHPFANVID